MLCPAHHAARHEGWLRIDGAVSTGLRWFNAAGKELVGPQVSTWWPEPPASPRVEVADTVCHTRVREVAPTRADVARASTGHAADAVRDARLGLRRTGLSLRDADVLIGVALAQLPATATASEIAAAAFRAMH